MRWKNVREDKASQKKKIIALKTILTISNKDEEFERDNNEDLSLLVKNIQRMFHKRGHFNNHRGIWQGKEERRENEIGPCYNCKKTGPPHCRLPRHKE